MKRLLSTLAAILLIATPTLLAQTQPTREVLFTLGENEKIYYGEYFAMATAQGNKFTAVIYNTETKEATFVFNGKRIKTVKYDEYGVLFYTLNVFYTNPSIENGYGYSYPLADRIYVNLEGKVLPTVKGYPYGCTRTKSGKYAFDYDDGVYIDGKIIENAYSLRLTESGKYAYRYKENGKWHVNIDGKTIGTYDDVEDLRLTESGKYAYRYKENEKWHVNIDGKTIGTYDYVGDLTLTESGKYAYYYRENGKYHVNIDGKTIGTYGDVYSLILTESGKYAYRYYENEVYSNINGRGNLSKEEYDNFRHTELDYNGSTVFQYWNDGSSYEKSVTEVLSKDNKHSFYSNYEYEYVVIDGEPVGKSPAWQAWYNEKENAFEWSALEDRELVVYKYKLN